MNRIIPGRIIVLAIILSCLALIQRGWSKEITFTSLLGELTDLDRLAEYPAPAYVCKQFSSYDRRSTDSTQRTDEGWFGNADACNFIRTETRNGQPEYVLLDAPGPGAIVQIWSANANEAGIIRIYLDGAAQPEIDLPMAEMLNGSQPLFPKPLAGIRGKGYNCYLPIPYAKHCKVTTSKNTLYYHVDYRTYAAGARVKTFSKPWAEKHMRPLQLAAQRLTSPEKTEKWGRRSRSEDYTKLIAPGATAEIQLEGQRAIRGLTCKVDAKDQAAALRGCLLEVFLTARRPLRSKRRWVTFSARRPDLTPTVRCRRGCWIRPHVFPLGDAVQEKRKNPLYQSFGDCDDPLG